MSEMIQNENKQITNPSTFNFEIRSLNEAMEYAKLIANSDLAPKDFKGKPGNVLIAIQMALELGLKSMQSIQNIAVINGRPSIWGDLLIALVQNHPICEYIIEDRINDTALCKVKRRGEPEYTAKFSIEDAKKAGLWGKSGPWTQYPDRMLQMRARTFAIRDKFADVLKGIAVREEVMDYQTVECQVIEEKKAEDLNSKLGLIPEYDMSQLSREINESKTLEELQDNYKRIYKIVKTNPNHLNVITELKDKCKTDLQGINDFLKEYDSASGEIKEAE